MNTNNIIPYKFKNFERSELDDILMIFSTYADVKFLNKTGAFIYENINGENSYQDILKKIISFYDDIDPNIIEKDLQDFLLSMKNLGYINFEGDLLMEEGTDYRIATESDYPKISEFVVNYLKNDKNYSSVNFLTVRNKTYYITANIRTRAFYLNEVFFVCMVDQMIVSIIGVAGYNEPQSALNLTALLCLENYEYTLDDLIRKTIDFAQKDHRYKMKIVFHNEMPDKLKSLINKWGFTYECVLKKEVGEIDFYIYSLYL